MYNKSWLHGAVFTGVLVVALTATGCNQSTPPPTSAMPTASVIDTPTPPPTPTPQDTAAAIPPTPTLTPNLTATAAACQPAAKVTGARTPDRAQFNPGETFTQTWRLSSSGNCAWEKNTLLAFQSGERFGAPDSTPVDAVDVGKSVEISLTLKAPQQAGVYSGQWTLQRPAGQVVITTSVRITVAVPAPAVAAVTPTKPSAAASAGPILPVGSGPFSVDENANGPWNCIGIVNGLGDVIEWMGDFYIDVRGGSGNYTISDSDHCRWDFAQQKFVCNYRNAINADILKTVTISCPGCQPQQVMISGRGVNSRSAGPGTCRVERTIMMTPTAAQAGQPPAPPPGQPVAPIFPKSPIQPWNRDAFVRALKASQDAVAAFRAEFVLIAAGKMGDCDIYFWKYYSQWEVQPAFSDVPINWYPLYYQYRVSLDNVGSATRPISNICLKHGGNIPEETDRLILATTQASIDTLGKLYAQAQAIK